MSSSFEAQIPDFIRLLELSLRSGYSITQSLEIVGRDMAPPLADDARALHVQLAGGTPLPEALAGWLRLRPSHGLDLVAATVAVQMEIGGNLADKLRLLRQIMGKRRLERD